MTRRDVVKEILRRDQSLRLTESDVTAVLTGFFDVVRDAILIENTSVTLRSFGTFMPREINRDDTRNPQTNEPLGRDIHRRWVVFGPGKFLKIDIDQEGPASPVKIM